MFTRKQQGADPSGVCPMMVVSSSNAALQYFSPFRVSHSSKHLQDLPEHLATLTTMTHSQGTFLDFLRTRPYPIMTKAPTSDFKDPITYMVNIDFQTCTTNAVIYESTRVAKTCYNVSIICLIGACLLFAIPIFLLIKLSVFVKILLALCNLAIQGHGGAELRIQPIPCGNICTELPDATYSDLLRPQSVKIDPRDV